MKSDLPKYSYKADPNVPDFDDAGLRTVMEAQCSICAHGARWIARNDTDERFKIIPLQSGLGTALMLHYGLDPKDPVSWLYLEDGAAYTSLDAIMRVGGQLGGASRMLSILRILPKGLQDRLYYLLARNRYRFGTKTTICTMPDPRVKKRLLE